MKSIYCSVAFCFLLSACGVQKTGEELQETFKKVEAARVAGEQENTQFTDAQKAYATANVKMHSGMGNIPADPDEAFMAGMIPHHQGAIDMAGVALKYGKDPEVRAFAQKIIAAQDDEIKQMQAWMTKQGKQMPAPPSADAPIDHSRMGH